jgi:hypothetical protein
VSEQQARRLQGDSPGLKVGVTLFLREGHQSLWENGIFQNCYFLLMALARSPRIARCFIVNGGPGDPAQAGDFLAAAPAPVIDLAAAMNELDVVIELSAQLDPVWGRQFVAKGGRIVGMRVANDFVIDAERMAFGLPPALLMSPVPYHEIWTLPAFARTCASYYQAGFRAPVRVMQHLWSPALVERAAAARRDGGSFAYRPGRGRWRLAVLEPNVCTVKTCQLPMLLCDVAHRREPRAIEYLRVFNAMAIKEHREFIAYARSLDLVRQGLATFEPRLPIFEIMGPIADAIVSHHWENAQNYLYYEALNGGFPLVHNSHLLDGCGYGYRSFDPEDGALALLQAFREHDRNLDSYRRDAHAFLEKLDPCRDENVVRYGDAVWQLFAPDERCLRSDSLESPAFT